MHDQHAIDDPTPLTLHFRDITAADLPRVGGKAANLGAMSRAQIPVPPGFCVTAAAFDQFMQGLGPANELFAALDGLDGSSVEHARIAAAAMREALSEVPMPAAVERAILDAWSALGAASALAVRSSATAEDLPGASFAGQQDTYLNIRGREPLLDAIRRCWASLFTDRAVLYRSKNGFGHRDVKLCVVVQQLIEPDVSGIMFTADPVSGHRATLSIDAGFGLGEALVSGLISADLYRYDRRHKRVTLARVGDKAFAIRSAPDGGTVNEPLAPAQREARALDDAQVHALAEVAETVERFYDGAPQDIEWCIRDGAIYLLQSRPITSLFPLPERHEDDRGLRLFVSFGHIQMMLDPMPAMAADLWRYFIPVGKGAIPTEDQPAKRSALVRTAGSRLFIDVTELMSAPRARNAFLPVLLHVYRDVARGIEALVQREEFIERPARVRALAARAVRLVGPVIGRIPAQWTRGEPERNALEAAERFDAVVREARARIESAASDRERVLRIAQEFNALFTRVRPALSAVIAGVAAHRALVGLARASWAKDVQPALDELLRGLPGNVTTMMDLAIGDLVDVAAQSEPLAALLRESNAPFAQLRAGIEQVQGGPAFLVAFDEILARYGDRGVAEIDVSRPRWRDDPSLLLRVVVGGLSGARAPGAHRQHHAQQVAIGERAARTLIDAAAKGPLGALRSRTVARLARVARAGLALREHPKWAIVRVLATARHALLRAGQTLVDRGQIDRAEDVFHLEVDELVGALEQSDATLRTVIEERRARIERDRGRRAPFVLSSDGETPTLEDDRTGLPQDALVGTAASAGVIEGVARIIRDPQREVLESGEILVAECTDPGWTPLFVHAAAVVTEVGGMMTHGAVVAREYGIPAVVSVRGATTKLRTGQRVRVDGTRGVVEPLEDAR